VTSPIGLRTAVLKHRVRHFGCWRQFILQPELTREWAELSSTMCRGCFVYRYVTGHYLHGQGLNHQRSEARPLLCPAVIFLMNFSKCGISPAPNKCLTKNVDLQCYTEGRVLWLCIHAVSNVSPVAVEQQCVLLLLFLLIDLSHFRRLVLWLSGPPLRVQPLMTPLNKQETRNSAETFRQVVVQQKIHLVA